MKCKEIPGGIGGQILDVAGEELSTLEQASLGRGSLTGIRHNRTAAEQIPPPYSRAEENARELNGRSE